MNQDLRAALLSAVYVSLVLGVGELARRRGISRHITRKIVHLGIGSWIVPTYLLFADMWWAVAPALGFVLLNAGSLRFGWIRSVEGEAHSVGTVLYPLSVALLLGWSFGTPQAGFGAAGVMAMTYGDAAASLVGRRIGRRRYHVAGHMRTLEGSLAMASVSFVAIAVALLCLGGRLDGALIAAAALAALAATLLEAISLFGFDNLLVPLGTAAVLYWRLGALP